MDTQYAYAMASSRLREAHDHDASNRQLVNRKSLIAVNATSSWIGDRVEPKSPHSRAPPGHPRVTILTPGTGHTPPLLNPPLSLCLKSVPALHTHTSSTHPHKAGIASEAVTMSSASSSLRTRIPLPHPPSPIPEQKTPHFAFLSTRYHPSRQGSTSPHAMSPSYAPQTPPPFVQPASRGNSPTLEGQEVTMHHAAGGKRRASRDVRDMSLAKPRALEGL